jgi:hypothetical protein
MSDTPNQNASGSADPFVAELQAVVGAFPPSAEQMERNKARKAERDFQAMKRRADARERRREEMKRGAMEALKRSKSV